jgi:hypothetical protein
VIHGQEDVPRMDRESLSACGRKFKHTGQGDDILRDGIVVPIERGMRRCFLEKDGFSLN